MDLLRSPVGCDNRFYFLLIALTILLAGYPYWGRHVGALIALAMLVPGVYAVHTNRRIFAGACVLAVIVGAIHIATMIRGVTGHPVVEGAFFLFYAFITLAIGAEILRTRRFMADTLSGAVSVYLLVGVSFGQLYDLIETLHPGSFFASLAEGERLGWSQLLSTAS